MRFDQMREESSTIELAVWKGTILLGGPWTRTLVVGEFVDLGAKSKHHVVSLKCVFACRGKRRCVGRPKEYAYFYS